MRRGAQPETLQVGDLTMNTNTRDVSRSGRMIQLSVKEYELLNFLMRGQGKVLERAKSCAVFGARTSMATTICWMCTSAICVKIESKELPL